MSLESVQRVAKDVYLFDHYPAMLGRFVIMAQSINVFSLFTQFTAENAMILTKPSRPVSQLIAISLTDHTDRQTAA